MFEHIVGNNLVKDYLSRLLVKRSVANSLLFAGPEGIGKSLFAQALATSLLGAKDHPDLHVYRPEGKIGLHSIDSMRQFSETVYMAPFSGAWKVFIIHDAERMLTYSANALLKTFEEPAPDAIVILISSAAASLLPTILSRCRTIHFQMIPEADIAAHLRSQYAVEEKESYRIASMANGSIGNAVRLLKMGEDQARALLLKTLAGGSVETYKELSEVAATLSEAIEEAKKGSEESIRSSLFHGPQDNLTAVQKESMQKEVDGILALRQRAEAQAFFDIIRGWYRDLELLKVNGSRQLLIHKDHENALTQTLQKGQTLEYDAVEEAIADAQLSLDRSTSLPIVLETLFLRLNLI